MTRWRRRPDLVVAPLADHLLVHDPRNRQVHALNPTASLIWAAVDEAGEVADTTEAVAHDVGLPPDHIGDHVARAMEDLAALDLLVDADLPPDPPAPSPSDPTVGRPAATPAGVDDLHVVALDQVTRIVAPDEARRPLEIVLAATATAAPADHEMRIEATEIGTWALFDDGEVAHQSGGLDAVLGHVLWRINHRAVSRSGGHLVLHAGAVAGPGGAVIIAGEPDAGKSTLTAAAVRRGAAYLSDEAVRLEAGLTISPYPKPVTLDVASLDLLGLGSMPDDPAVLAGPRSIRHLDPRALGTVATTPVPVAAVVLPDRSIRGDLTEPLGPVEAALALAGLTFDLPGGGQRALDDLVGLVTACPVRRLPTGDLGAAAATVVDLAARPRPGA